MNVTYCISSWAKMKGLIAKPYLKQDEYYVFPACNAIHTFGLRFPIDVVFCNKFGEVVRYNRLLSPNRIVFVAKAFFAIEFVSDQRLDKKQLRTVVDVCLHIKQFQQNHYRWI